jgi:hypothetical protein
VNATQPPFGEIGRATFKAIPTTYKAMPTTFKAMPTTRRGEEGEKDRRVAATSGAGQGSLSSATTVWAPFLPARSMPANRSLSVTA